MADHDNDARSQNDVTVAFFWRVLSAHEKTTEQLFGDVATLTTTSRLPSRAEHHRYALVGLLTSEFRCPAFSPSFSSEKLSNGQKNGPLIALSYSGGDRPGISPGSLYVGSSNMRWPTTNTTISVNSNKKNIAVKWAFRRPF